MKTLYTERFKFPKNETILSQKGNNMESKNKKEIMNLFRKNIFLKASIREISKQLKKKSYQRIYDAVKDLEDKKILKLERIGKSDVVSLELNHQSLFHLAYLDEKEPAGKIPNYEKLMNIREISNYLLMVTGSYAKGTATKKSDLDLVIIAPDNQKAIDIQKLVENMTLVFYPKVHLYVFNNKDLLEMLLEKKENYGKEIYKNHLVLKNAHIYYEILREAQEHGFKG
jgi:predicted nucleotidyltransferase